MPDLLRDSGHLVHFETRGDPEAPAVVLLHGFTSDLRSWAPVMDSLDPDFHLIAIDLRGHGQSGAPEDPGEYSVEACAEDVRAVLEELNIELAAVVGCSYGSMVALQFATTWPERVAGLVVTDSSPAYDCDRYDEAFRERERGIDESAEFVQRFGMAALGKRAAAGISDGFLAAGVRERYARMSADGFLGTAKARRERPNLIPLLGERLRMPVLVCAGEKDAAYSGSKVLAEELAHARFVTFRDTGHAVPMLRPDTFVDVLLQFFGDIEEGGQTGGHRTV